MTIFEEDQRPITAPSRPVNPRGDYHLDRAVQWSNQRRNTHFDAPNPPGDPEWNWLVERGLENRYDYDWVYDIIVKDGLDCVLEIDKLPDGNDFFWNPKSEFWTDHKYNLIKIKTMPGPLWLNFIASDYKREDPEYPFHLSLCYRDELYEWYREDYNADKIIMWINRYRIIQQRYNGRKARLMTSQNLSRGHTFIISTNTRVEGLRPPHVVSDDPGGDDDVRYVHKLPGHQALLDSHGQKWGKADQDLHVSLIM